MSRLVQIKSFTFESLDGARDKRKSPVRRSISRKSFLVLHTPKSIRQESETIKKKLNLVYCDSHDILNFFEKRPSIPVSDRFSTTYLKYMKKQPETSRNSLKGKTNKSDKPNNKIIIRDQFVSYRRPITPKISSQDTLNLLTRPSTAKIPAQDILNLLIRPSSAKLSSQDTSKFPIRPSTAKATSKQFKFQYPNPKESINFKAPEEQKIEIFNEKNINSATQTKNSKGIETLRINIKTPLIELLIDSSSGDELNPDGYISTYKYSEAKLN